MSIAREELCAIVDRDLLRKLTASADTLEHLGNLPTREIAVRVKREALTVA